MNYIIFQLIFTVLTFQYEISNSQLVVNVKNNGGEVIQESIEANTTADTVRLTFRKFDGTMITQFIEFKNEIQIFRAVVLGEEERNEPPYQVLCFITPFLMNEFITSDAMSKLRQKNADAIRHPEEEKDREIFGLDVKVDSNIARIISPSIGTECAGAHENIFSNETYLARAVTRLHRDQRELLPLTTKRTSFRGLSDCRNQVDISRPCICNYEICIGWYPCGLKYCKGQDSTGNTVNYRCGIKTCKKCRVFRYYTAKKLNCMWDENDTDYFKTVDNEHNDVIKL